MSRQTDARSKMLGRLWDYGHNARAFSQEKKNMCAYIDARINPYLRKYAVRMRTQGATVFDDSMYIEAYFDVMSYSIPRKQFVRIAKYVWEFLAGREYETRGVYNTSYYGDNVPYGYPPQDPSRMYFKIRFSV